MMIDAIAHWNPAPGRIVTVRPTPPATAAADATPAHPVPPSTLQEGHLHGTAATARAGRRHSVYLAAATEVDGGFDPRAIAEALRRFVIRHDGLRSWFSVSGADVTRHVVDADHVAFTTADLAVLDDHGWVRGGPRRDDHIGARRLHEFVDTEFGQRASALRWPGFELGAIVRDRSTTLFWFCDHALTDGVSQAMALAEIADLYVAERDGTPPGPFTTAPVGSAVEYARQERIRAAAYGEGSAALHHWMTTLRAHGLRMPHSAVDLGLAPGETAPVRSIRFDVLDADGAQRFAQICSAAGGGVTAGVVAAIATADHELTGDPSWFGITALADRDLADVHLAQGWFCRFAPVAFPVAEARRFTDLVPRAQRAGVEATDASHVPVPTVMAALIAAGADPAEAMVTPQLLSYLDFRRSPHAGTPTYDRGIQTTGEGRTANASVWVNRDEHGMYLGTQTPDTPVAQERLAHHHRRLRAIFAEIAATGDRVITRAPDHTRMQEVASGAGHHR
ncbi:condensation domain-containing protein [Williamsia deligens]|uniref:Condensation domain-containing protein n=1 Tax=Williamsia deligens TaxID=321325 RepID=A0ABW3GB41_9NOCA|nr:condensation domain-containing protein [Williamsia deligens]MCP2196178.1 Condensation domain-containing protein [Williamsia deligens]